MTVSTKCTCHTYIVIYIYNLLSQHNIILQRTMNVMPIKSASDDRRVMRANTIIAHIKYLTRTHSRSRALVAWGHWGQYAFKTACQMTAAGIYALEVYARSADVVARRTRYAHYCMFEFDDVNYLLKLYYPIFEKKKEPFFQGSIIILNTHNTMC